MYNDLYQQMARPLMQRWLPQQPNAPTLGFRLPPQQPEQPLQSAQLLPSNPPPLGNSEVHAIENPLGKMGKKRQQSQMGQSPYGGAGGQPQGEMQQRLFGGQGYDLGQYSRGLSFGGGGY